MHADRMRGSRLTLPPFSFSLKLTDDQLIFLRDKSSWTFERIILGNDGDNAYDPKIDMEFYNAVFPVLIDILDRAHQ